ncbi:MAG: hypothetical protein M3186_00930 [Actinomycetota bacterium]|nr:hypothetical protein [Actinomycetota bacterium]
MHGTRDDIGPVRPPFEIVLRGFDRQQVIDHVNALKARVATLGTERDAALQRAADLNDSVEQLRQETADVNRQLDRLRQEATDAAAEVDRLQRSPLTAATARIQRMLQMAEDEAAELRNSVENEAGSVRESARAEADRLLEETRRQCARMEAESRNLRQTTEAETATRRKQVQQQTEQDIARRRAETEASIHEYQTRSIAALYVIMQIASERLSNRMTKVQRQVTAARQLRSEVTGQLSDVYRLLAEALGVVDQPTAAEQAESTAHAEPSDRSPQREPAADAGGSDGSRAPRRRERIGPAGRPRQVDHPATARFGLHP